VTGVRVVVPASTANLGSGFDALGLALGLYDEVDVRVSDGGLVVNVTGEGAAAVPTDETHLVVRAFRAAAELIGFSAPGLVFDCRNTIPHSRGLGSSAAAIAAGVAAAVSGAGPTVLALPKDGELPVGVDVTGFDVRRCPVDVDGVRVAPLG
jgi:homoserine kinase